MRKKLLAIALHCRLRKNKANEKKYNKTHLQHFQNQIKSINNKHYCHYYSILETKQKIARSNEQHKAGILLIQMN